jgi:hypothetical protein
MKKKSSLIYRCQVRPSKKGIPQNSKQPFSFLPNFTKFQPEKYDFNLYKEFSMKQICSNSPDLKKQSFQIMRFL